MRTDLPLILAFAAALAAPWVDRVVRPEVALSARAELREPAPLPELGLAPAVLNAFPAGFERWFSDRLGLRDRLLRGHNAVHLLGFGVAPAKILFVGADRWMFTTDNDSIGVHRGLVPFGAAELVRRRRELERRRDFCRGIGARFVYAVVPNKEAIYPERVPAAFRPVGPTRLDELVAAQAGDPSLDVVDLRAGMRAERAFDLPDAQDFTFSPDGTHWTGRGAFGASVTLFERLAAIHPAFSPPLARSQFERVEAAGSFDSDSWAGQLFLEDVLQRPFFAFSLAGPRAVTKPGTNPDWGAVRRELVVPGRPDLPRVFLAHDSLGPWMRPLLAERCSELVAIWGQTFPADEILAARPDIVIEMRCERALVAPILAWVEEPRPVPAQVFAALRAHGPPGGLLAAAETPEGRPLEKLAEGGVAFDLAPGSDKLVLPAIELAPEANAFARIELSSPADTTLTIWYTTRAQPEYRKHNVVRLPVAAGRSGLCLWLPIRGASGRLMVAPGEEPGRYLVHAFELKSAF